jgi:hypothetical protein
LKINIIGVEKWGCINIKTKTAMTPILAAEPSNPGKA